MGESSTRDERPGNLAHQEDGYDPSHVRIPKEIENMTRRTSRGPCPAPGAREYLWPSVPPTPWREAQGTHLCARVLA